MLAIFGLGIVVGILLVIALLRATMSYEPTGCILILGLIILFVFSIFMLTL